MKSRNFNLIFNTSIISFMFVSLIGLVLAHGGEITNSYNENMMSWYYGSMFGIGFLGWILMIVITVALILFIIWMIKNLKKNKK